MVRRAAGSWAIARDDVADCQPSGPQRLGDAVQRLLDAATQLTGA